MTTQEWKSKGKFVRINDNNIFVIDVDPSSKLKDTIVILYGYPTTSYDYHKVIPILSKYYRVVIHDYFGFGFSDLPNSYCFSIVEQANVCIQLLKKLNVKNATFLADGYGSKIAKEILWKKNANLISLEIKNLIITDSWGKKLHNNLSAIDELAKNKKLSKYKEVLINYQNRDFFKSSENDETNKKYENEDKVRTIWQKFNQLEKQKQVLILSSYNEEIYLYWHRWIRALKGSTIPIKIFWRRDNFENIQDTLLHLATFQKDNIKVLENEKCYVLENEPKSWLFMILKELDKTVYYSLKEEHFKY